MPHFEGRSCHFKKRQVLHSRTSIMQGPNGMQPPVNAIKLENPSYYCNSYTPPAPEHTPMMASGAYSKNMSFFTHIEYAGNARATSEPDSNPNIPVTGNAFKHESGALDYVSTDWRWNKDYMGTKIRSKGKVL
ncbi:unnamed protein product [Timema podura]|uniref:Uncharacterized protein n=1 Tax=Timema podura TaxID=61482 RepID=A0ABN7NJX1_TIMPD|nr:unnamed protein product [Timema podura]